MGRACDRSCQVHSQTRERLRWVFPTKGFRTVTGERGVEDKAFDSNISGKLRLMETLTSMHYGHKKGGSHVRIAGTSDFSCNSATIFLPSTTASKLWTAESSSMGKTKKASNGTVRSFS